MSGSVTIQMSRSTVILQMSRSGTGTMHVSWSGTTYMDGGYGNIKMSRSGSI
jgi:hypothetical protein